MSKFQKILKKISPNTKFVIEQINENTMQEFENTAVLRNLGIHNSYAFINSEDKTQIVRPKKIDTAVYKTRQTHSEEVAIMAEFICNHIGFKYPQQVKNVCLLHDIGHPPFGHDGQRILDKKMKELGLEEGFSDNNANFDVIFNNDIKISSYELVSLIKRPNELYDYQKQMFKKILKQSLKFEEKQWGKKNKTMGSLIMDISDEISYSFSDFIDGYVLGYNEHHIIKFLENVIKFSTDKNVIKSLNKILKSVSLKKSKRNLRNYVTELKFIILNSIYYDKKTTSLKMNFNNYEVLLKFMKFNEDFFIHTKKLEKERKKDLIVFEKFCNYILTTKNFHSDMYRAKHYFISTENDKTNELRNIRNMIADTTDNYVLQFVKNNKI
jgi:dGTP triphosphohydrolase